MFTVTVLWQQEYKNAHLINKETELIVGACFEIYTWRVIYHRCTLARSDMLLFTHAVLTDTGTNTKAVTMDGRSIKH